MIKFIRNDKTGVLEAWEDGKKIGIIVTMGDLVTERKRDNGN